MGSKFKEVYIRLIENESTLVCTARYGGLIGKSKRFALDMGTESPSNLDEQSSSVRIRDQRGGDLQSGR